MVTRNAVGLHSDVDPVAAAAWGLVASAQGENPGRIVLVDLDGDVDHVAQDVDGEVRRAVAAGMAAGEPQLAVRGIDLWVPRLTRVAPPAASAENAFGDATVLVTGATGAVGSLLVRHLAGAHGVRDLLLVSRRGGDAEGATELAADLAGAGARVRFAAADVADQDALAGVLAGEQLSAVVHIAGHLDDGLVTGMTPERVAGVLRPKADAARNLHELTAGADLKAFVVFSSAASVLGPPGQSPYTAANRYLNALVEQRRAAGLPGVSMAWGLWNLDSGMNGGLTDAERARLARSGMLPLEPAEGLALFDAALATGQELLVPIRLDLRALRGLNPEMLPPLMRGLVTRPGARPRPGRPAAPSPTGWPA